MSSSAIIESWKAHKFKPLYWLEGNEDYYIDQVIQYAEHNILSEDQSQFNLTIFYGGDADWADVMNACRRYPVFSDKQVVLLKEAQLMRSIDKLAPYVEKPNGSTILVVSYKGKTIDGRTKFAKNVKEHGELFTSKKIYDNQLPGWIKDFVQSKGFNITPKALALLESHVGNDLSRLSNEINKLIINLKDAKSISEDDIEKYIGISKDYNVYELQKALCFKDRVKAMNIIQYIEADPMAIPLQYILPTLYSFFSKLMGVYQMKDKSERALRGVFFNNPVAVEQAMTAQRNYSFYDLEKTILLLHHYNLKMLGIGSYNNTPASLLKELVFKIME
jgi:DNA polymerase-3 subunit delta